MADTTVTLTGNLTRAPELRFTQSGLSVCNFGIAVNRFIPGRNGQESKEETHFFNVTAWDTLANNVADLSTGDRVLVHGRLAHRTWETDEGDKRSTVEIVAEEVGASLRWASVEITKNPKKGEAQAPAPAETADAEPF